MPHYVTFLLDLAGSGENRAIAETVRTAPDPEARPKTAFVWKVVCDAAGHVVVSALEKKKLVVIGTARWAGTELTSLKQRAPGTPTGYQWNLVEKALLAEQAKRFLDVPDHAGPTEDIEAIERQLVARERDWTEGEVAESENKPVRETDQPAYRAQRRKRLVRAFASLGGTLAAIGVLTALSMSRKPEAKAPAPAPPPPSPVVADPPPPPPAPPPPTPAQTPEERVTTATTLDEAIALAKPAMSDSDDEVSPGAALLARYARMQWSDVSVQAETSLPLVLKDPEVERGKRLCVDGEIERIERRDLDKRKLFVGRLHTAEGDAVEFVAVGTTGQLVKRSKSKFCGVVIGRARGAAKLVGMFDLPENQSPLVEQ
ncbi:MAG: hypothetical protein SFX73_35130 [Kofleriaceae bacterium]|nr:hypothetical protein [Kofleriaceae bacterium]